MAGFRARSSPMKLAGGSPMKGTSSSASKCEAAEEREPVPLIECPQCGIPVIKLRSKQADTFNCIFYKCPNNFRNDTTCSYFWWETDYVKYVRGRKQKQVDVLQEHEAVCEAVDSRQDILDLRQQTWELKVELGELKHKTSQGKAVVIDNAILAAVFVGIVIGMLVTMVWK